MIMGMKQRPRSCKEAATRAWRLLRLALLWARRGGVLRCRLITDLRRGISHLGGRKHDVGMIRYGERLLSFDETPIIRFRMKRARRSRSSSSLRLLVDSCIKPGVVEFDYEFDDDDDDDGGGGGDDRESNVDDYYNGDDLMEEEMMMMNAATDFFSMQTLSTL